MTDIKIVKLETEFYGEIPPDQILEQWKGQGLTELVLVGIDKDGKVAVSGSHSSMSKTFFLMECARRHLWKLMDDA